jgi:DnaA family protein
MKQIPLDILAEPDSTLEHYLPGPNAWVLAQLFECLPEAAGQGGARSGVAGAPIYLWGPTGVGKSHLCRGWAALWQGRGASVAWFSPERDLPWALEPQADLLVFDACERFDALQQHAAFACFVDAATSGTQVLANGAFPPVDLPLREDLRTRLGWGHVLAVSPLSEAQTRAALRMEADRRGLFLSDEVLDYLLSRFARDLKHLMALLQRLDAYALVHKRAITLPLLRQMLAQEFEP